MLVALVESAASHQIVFDVGFQANVDYVVYGIENEDEQRFYYLRDPSDLPFLVNVPGELFFQVASVLPDFWISERSAVGPRRLVTGPPELVRDPYFSEHLADGDPASRTSLDRWMEESGDFGQEDGLARLTGLVASLRDYAASGAPLCSTADLLFAYRKGWARLPEASQLSRYLLAQGADDPQLGWIAAANGDDPTDIDTLASLARRRPLRDAATHRAVWARLLGDRGK